MYQDYQPKAQAPTQVIMVKPQATFIATKEDCPSTCANCKLWSKACAVGLCSCLTCFCGCCGCCGSIDAPDTLLVRNDKTPVPSTNNKASNVVQWCIFGLFSSIYAPCTCCGMCCGCCCKLTPREFMDFTRSK
jgi:hypothetical protein